MPDSCLRSFAMISGSSTAADASLVEMQIMPCSACDCLSAARERRSSLSLPHVPSHRRSSQSESIRGWELRFRWSQAPATSFEPMQHTFAVLEGEGRWHDHTMQSTATLFCQSLPRASERHTGISFQAIPSGCNTLTLLLEPHSKGYWL